MPHELGETPGEVVSLDISGAVPMQLGAGTAGSWPYELDLWPLPTAASQCKQDGWKAFGYFGNQGACVSSTTTTENSRSSEIRRTR